MIKPWPKKRFGQHFLIDEHVILQIVNLIAPNSEDYLVEIGPGLGAITFPLLPLVAKIDAIELDYDLIPNLFERSRGLGNLVIHQHDVLKFELSQLTTQDKSLRVVGNLPYNISTPLLFHLFGQNDLIKDMHFMFQKEVGQRLTAKHGTKQYGRLTVMAQYYCQIEALLEVPGSAFKPPPKVDSLFISLVPRQHYSVRANNLGILDKLVKQAFAQRRKMLCNSLKGMVTKEQLSSLGITPSLRAEELTVDNFVKISNIIETK